ncbi:MAG: hypothetical protein HY979_03125 [Candidatus Magasanikbacteria bacterium]|nr:hypothetical protein [Candidatus Magasanikbacteria bacterium]
MRALDKDVIEGHFAHIIDDGARRRMEELAVQRIEGLGTRFSAGMELTAQPPRMFRELGYDPVSDASMARSSNISIGEIENAVAQGRLRLNHTDRRNRTSAA